MGPLKRCWSFWNLSYLYILIVHLGCFQLSRLGFPTFVKTGACHGSISEANGYHANTMPSIGFTLCLMLKFPWESHMDVPLINSPCVPNWKRGENWEPPTTSARCRCNHLTQLDVVLSHHGRSPDINGTGESLPWKHPWHHGCCDVVWFTLWLWLT